MSEIAIRVENLGKRYLLGFREPYQTLRESLMKVVRLAKHQKQPENNSRQYTIWALKGVSFEVKKGEVVGIIGRNGAGKSTLLKILSRITEPTEGYGEIHGRIGSLLEVGTGFHPELTGRENIYLNGAILGMKRAEIQKKFTEIASFAEVEKFLDTPVKYYSSGMYTRLSFAVAAHLEAEILLVDEVLAVGDVIFQKKCLNKMDEVAKEGRTVLFVSHNLAAMQRLCTLGLLLEKGLIAYQGTIAETVKTYLQSSGDPSLHWVSNALAAKKAYFQTIAVVDSEGQQSVFVETGGQLRVCLKFFVEHSYPNLQVSVALLDEYGSVIFGSCPQDAGLESPHRRGKYQATVVFPPELLLAKRYGLEAVLWTPEFGVIDRVEAIQFLVQETSSLANSTPGGRAGLVALRCHWKMQQAEDAEER